MWLKHVKNMMINDCQDSKLLLIKIYLDELFKLLNYLMHCEKSTSCAHIAHIAFQAWRKRLDIDNTVLQFRLRTTLNKKSSHLLTVLQRRLPLQKRPLKKANYRQEKLETSHERL